MTDIHAENIDATVPGVHISLTDLEQKLFDTMRSVVTKYELSTTVRVAGGWVRDKVLGKDSDDIDIALDNMSGTVVFLFLCTQFNSYHFLKTFAQHVNTYLKANGEPTSRIGVIQANPNQSKHLETATVKVFGTFIDFVNLRSETYADDSRIPAIVPPLPCALINLTAYTHAHTHHDSPRVLELLTRTQCGVTSLSTPCSTMSTVTLWKTSHIWWASTHTCA
jgi:hypothetical protein